MFSWSDVSATLGIIALAILAGWLKVLPEKVVVAMVTAALGYYAARTALLKHREKSADGPAEKLLTAKEKEEGAPSGPADSHQSGRIEIDPQDQGRIVRVGTDGRVVIGPAPGTDYRHDPAEDTDQTPVEHRHGVGGDDDDVKE